MNLPSGLSSFTEVSFPSLTATVIGWTGLTDDPVRGAVVITALATGAAVVGAVEDGDPSGPFWLAPGMGVLSLWPAFGVVHAVSTSSAGTVASNARRLRDGATHRSGAGFMSDTPTSETTDSPARGQRHLPLAVPVTLSLTPTPNTRQLAVTIALQS